MRASRTEGVGANGAAPASDDEGLYREIPLLEHLVLSQSEDQSRPHPVLIFVHLISTQVRGLGLNMVEGGPRSDPQIATHARILVVRQVPGRRSEDCVELSEIRAVRNEAV